MYADDNDNEYSFHQEYTLYDGAARSGGHDHSDDYDGGYSKSDDSHGYGNNIKKNYIQMTNQPLMS